MHFAILFASGVQAAGRSQYANASAGLAAMSDPSSEAASFRAYQLTRDPLGDHSYTAAFAAVSKYYTLADVPNSLSTWDDDMNNVAVALFNWVTNTPDWQIGQISTAKFRVLEAAVVTAINQARAEINNVIAGR